ncbi:MAG: DUF4368 domain-containing protein, partial [Defluviitaleaceae bacterium]|nr:DUF4368 domain-containing protein [Defluviitaleaceae bacterium]MCL2263192.1 DUF4368 domain-containing protein [Defluviitaleaceae bacterium]
IEVTEAKDDDLDRFFKLADQYTEFKELTPAIARTFIEKIVIHEGVFDPVKKRKKLSQQIDIYITFIGKAKIE